MLHEIRLRHVGVIEEAELSFSPGLTVLSGETGAGKTMVVTALGLLLGARADTSLVRAGSPAAYVEGVFAAPDGAAFADLVAELDADIEGELILSRTVSREGRSRAGLDGRTVPSGVLAQLGEALVAVHGQADQWRLRSAKEHREILDQVGGAPIQAALSAYRQSFDRHTEALAAAARLRAEAAERLTELDALRYGLDQIDGIDPEPGEDVDLRAEAERLTHVDGLRHAAAFAHEALVGGDDTDPRPGAPAAGLIGAARQVLSTTTGHDNGLDDLAGRLTELGYLVDDLAGDLAAYLDDIESDPARLAWVQDRLAALGSLTRRYGATADDVREWARVSRLRVRELDQTDDRLAAFEAEAARSLTDLGERAGRLSALRAEVGKRFSEAVSAELAHLAMGSTRVVVALDGQPAADGLAVPGRTGRWRFTRDGIDDVDIQLVSGAGTLARSVSKGASGGELSRVMLALELVAATAAGSTVPTMVFDEVDAGVGGKAALDVAARLAALARHTQVVVVTHLAQVAAFADVHLVVRKSDDGRIVASDVREVTDEDRLDELARMMSGGVSESARRHAAELVALATARRASREVSAEVS